MEKIILTCPFCGEDFVREQVAQKFCSARCRQSYYAKKEIKNKYREPKVYVCAWCGRAFESDRKKKYCCDDCRIRAYDQRPRKRKKPKLTLEQVALLSGEAGLSYGQYVEKMGL